ncbi:MAG TPA: enoyl-CoA hydratase, partial [Rubrivivax sp.]|nr:enoyl-CoA hydratase [Rubrivivax sp.]
AERWGLVHERCAPGGLDTLVQQRASALAALPPHALRQQKHLLQHWQTASLTQAVQHSIDQFALAYTSGEPQALMGEFMARKLARSKSRT